MTTDQSRPSVTTADHSLFFDQLTPDVFERLCLWLITREGYERAEHLGVAGSDQGLDIIAWREGELWGFQCKRVKRFGPNDVIRGVEKVLMLPDKERPRGLFFLVTCSVSARARELARQRCYGTMECYFWTDAELFKKIRQYPEITQEFFGLDRVDLLQPSKPLVGTATAHVLPFDRLSPVDFERMCLWLVDREGYSRSEHIGLTGSEQGRDVVAYKPTPQGEELWYFSVKRYRLASAQSLMNQVDKCLELTQREPRLHPVGVVFVLSGPVSARVREVIGSYCQQHGLVYRFWALTELDMLVKKHPEIVREFFALRREDLFQPTMPHTATAQVLRFDQLSFQDLRQLCLRLFQKEGYQFLQVQPVKVTGETDTYLIAGNRNQAGSEIWVFEWSEEKPIDVSSLTAKVWEIRSLMQTFPFVERISGVHFVQGAMIPADIRTEVHGYSRDLGIKTRFWGWTELDELAKRYPGIVKEYLDQPSLAKHLNGESELTALSHLFSLCLDASLSSYDKGKVLEDLATALFEPCFEIINNVRTETGEIDLVLARKDTAPLFWADYGVIAMAECKNRSKDNPVKSSEIIVLVGKCEHANVKLGFFVSLGPFTKDALERISRENEKHAYGPLIVPVRREDIENLTSSGAELDIWLRGLVMPARLGQKEFYSYGFRSQGSVTRKD